MQKATLNFENILLQNCHHVICLFLYLTGSSGEFLIPDLLRLDIECPGLGLSLNISSRNSIGGGTDGIANDSLKTPLN